MEIKEGITISGIDVYGREVQGKIISTINTFGLATIKIGPDRLDQTVISFSNIKR